MSTVREKIINALTLFYTAIKSKFVLVGNVVNNCASTSTTYPLAANQGTQLQNQIDELNSNLIKKKSDSIDFVIGTTQYFNAVSVYDKNGDWKKFLLSRKIGDGVYASQYSLTYTDNKYTLHIYDEYGNWLCKFTCD